MLRLRLFYLNTKIIKVRARPTSTPPSPPLTTLPKRYRVDVRQGSQYCFDELSLGLINFVVKDLYTFKLFLFNIINFNSNKTKCLRERNYRVCRKGCNNFRLFAAPPETHIKNGCDAHIKQTNLNHILYVDRFK